MQSFRFNRTNWLAASAAPVRVFYGGGKSQQSSSQVSIPPEILSQYSNVNSIANQVATTPFQQYSTDPNAFVAPLDATQQAGVLGTNQDANEAQPFYQAASNQNTAASAPVSASQIQSYENPYLSDVINPTSQLLNQQYATAQSGQLGNAINQGAFGGDRSAVAAANLQQQQGLAYGQTIGGLENQNYSQALGEANTQQQAGMAGAMNEANIGSGAQAAGLAGAQAQLTAGQAQQQTEQAGETALYNQFLQQQSYPFQTTQFLANIAEGTGALSGTTTNSSQPAPFFSDERLKEDIQKVGKLHDGLDVIKYRYKGDKQTHLGLSAQDVEKKHPEAVGLAGGYKTVDYDAATRSAAENGRYGNGDFEANGRHQRAEGGGFNLDPSYLEAQQQAYAGAPWGNAGAGVGGAPYGGKSHVPPSTGGGHAQLATAKAPAMSSQSGLGSMASTLGQIEGLGKEGKSLWNDAKGSGLAGGLAGAVGLGTPPVGAPAPAQPAVKPPLANEPQSAGAGPVATPIPDPSAGRANAGQLASLDGLGGMGSDADLASDFAARGGFLHRDAGGATYQDAADDDSSAGGDVPYDSGTGMKGLTVPDDKPHNSLPTAQAPSSNSSSSGGFNPLSLVTGALGLFRLASGGRVGLAGGGDPSDIALPSMDDAASIQGGVAPPDQAAALAKHATPDAVLPTFTVKDKHPAVAPKAGLAPNMPSPDAQPVQAQQEQQDMGSGQQATQPGQVLTQDNPGGIGDALNRNQGLLVPLLHGLGTMASSNSRYLGSAVLQGLGGAADSYEKTQDDMQQRLGNQPIIQQKQNDATQSDLGLWQSYRGQNPGAANMTFAQFEQLKASGKLNSYNGSNGSVKTGGPGDANGPFNFTPQEYQNRKLANGMMAYQDPSYVAGFKARNAGASAYSPYVRDTVAQANHDSTEMAGNGFTTNAQGSRQPVPGFDSTALAQNHPAVVAEQAKTFQDQGTAFNKEAQRSMSLLDELGGVYSKFQAGPTSNWRASVARIANEFDPSGAYPFLHSVPTGNDAANYDIAMKDMAQLTASQLGGMPGGAPKAETDLLNSYGADPHKSPEALRDIIIRGKANLQQQSDYYSNFDPFANGAKGVPSYTRDFYKNNPYEGYRSQFDKTTPHFAGEITQPPPGGGSTQVAPIPEGAKAYLKNNPGAAAQFDAKYGAGNAKRILGQ